MSSTNLSVFTYSPEGGNTGCCDGHQIDEEVKLDRQAGLMELQQDISAEYRRAQDRPGASCYDRGQSGDEDASCGAEAFQATHRVVDGYVLSIHRKHSYPATFCKSENSRGALEYDLIGEIANEFY